MLDDVFTIYLSYWLRAFWDAVFLQPKLSSGQRTKRRAMAFDYRNLQTLIITLLWAPNDLLSFWQKSACISELFIALSVALTEETHNEVKAPQYLRVPFSQWIGVCYEHFSSKRRCSSKMGCTFMFKSGRKYFKCIICMPLLWLLQFCMHLMIS